MTSRTCFTPDVRNTGEMLNRTQKAFSQNDIEKLAGTYHEWRNMKGKYEDISGFCKSVKLDEIKSHDYVLTPGRYVGAVDNEDDGTPFEEKMQNITIELSSLLKQSSELESSLRSSLKAFGYEL